MSDNKKYYYLKLKENFYERDEMIMLESMADGYMYSNILLKLYLRSLKNDGKLLFNNRIPYNVNMLANVVRMPVAIVEKALCLFKDLELIEILDNGAIYMLDIQNFIGESSTEADRKRGYRKQIETEKLLLTGQAVGQMSDKNPPEKEKEKERDLEIDNINSEVDTPQDEKKPKHNYNEIAREVIEYLNTTANKNFKTTTKSNLQMIAARLKEGYTKEDLFKVIDNMTKAWATGFINGVPANNYLRPSTLFRPSNIDGYLEYDNSRQAPKQPQQQYFKKDKGTFCNYEQTNYDWEKLEDHLLGVSDGETDNYSLDSLVKHD